MFVRPGTLNSPGRIFSLCTGAIQVERSAQDAKKIPKGFSGVKSGWVVQLKFAIRPSVFPPHITRYPATATRFTKDSLMVTPSPGRSGISTMPSTSGKPSSASSSIALTILFGWLARYTRLGRNLDALGSNPQSARFAGLSEAKGIAFVFVLSGFLCGLVGVLWGARFGTVDAVIARGLNLEVISAVVVGGVSIFGGSGTVYGAALGAVIFAVLQNGVQLLHVNQFWIEAVVGMAILGTVVFYVTLARRTERAQREARRRAATGRAAGT